MATESQKLKPCRSEADELTEGEKKSHDLQVKKFLEETVPVRALKPSRSEASDTGASAGVPADVSQTELHRFEELEANDERLQTEGGTVNDDSYVETEYYDDLNAVDKSSHHETGTGFISTEHKDYTWHLEQSDHLEPVFNTSHGTNPSTNEWQPAPPVDTSMESKVHRSDP